MKRQGRVGQTSCMNVHTANLGSQLSIFYTGSFARAHPPPNDPTERVHMGAFKRPARTSSHGRLKRPTRTTRPNGFTGAPSNDPPERHKRSDKGEPGKRAARTCTKPTLGHNLAFLIRAHSPRCTLARTSSHGRPQTTRPNDRNEPTRESRANELHKRAQSQPWVTT